MQAPMVSLQSTAKVNIIIGLCDFPATEPPTNSGSVTRGETICPLEPLLPTMPEADKTMQKDDAKAKRAISLIRRRDRTLYPAF
jgi:hypothetical protein